MTDGANACKRLFDEEEFLSNGKGELGRFRGESNPMDCLEDSLLSSLLPFMSEAPLKWAPVGLSRFSVQSQNSVWSLSGEGVGGRGLTGGGYLGGGCKGGGKGGGAYFGRTSRLLSSVDFVETVLSEVDVARDAALDGTWEGKVYEEMEFFSEKIYGVGVEDLRSVSGSKTQETRAKGSGSGVRTRSMGNGSFPGTLDSAIMSGKPDRWAGDAGLERRR